MKIEIQNIFYIIIIALLISAAIILPFEIFIEPVIDPNSSFITCYNDQRLLSWIVFFIINSIMVLLVGSVQNRRIKKRHELEKRLYEMRLKTLRSQMDPHFTFNALNSVSNAILNQDKHIANQTLVKYSQLLRQLFENADDAYVPLEQEISFNHSYLEIEKIRMKERLEYAIQVDQNVDVKRIVPRMIIQLFIENAIKHGVSEIDYAGEIQIIISQKGHTINVIIDDNGVGIEKIENDYLENNDGIGIAMIDEMIDLCKYTGKLNFCYDIYNKSKIGQKGTKVELYIY